MAVVAWWKKYRTSRDWSGDTCPLRHHPDAATRELWRVYAAYGGVFVVLSLLWGWQIDKISPDKFDLIGGVIALAGVAIIMYAPRG